MRAGALILALLAVGISPSVEDSRGLQLLLVGIYSLALPVAVGLPNTHLGAGFACSVVSIIVMSPQLTQVTLTGSGAGAAIVSIGILDHYRPKPAVVYVICGSVLAGLPIVNLTSGLLRHFATVVLYLAVLWIYGKAIQYFDGPGQGCDRRDE